ncbi:hypothetical protein [Pseudomonas kilonensis]
MNRHLSIYFSLILATLAPQALAWGKEPIEIKLSFSEPKKIAGESYQVIAINSYAAQAFCEDSFKNSIARSLIGSSKTASLLVTMDKIPILNMSYNDKNGKCTLHEWRDKGLNGQLLSAPTKPDHQLNLIYASEEKIDSINNLISVAKTALGAEVNLLSAPITEIAMPYLVQAYEQASKAGLDYTAEFEIPGAQTQESKAALQGTIGDKKPWDLLSFEIITKDSVLDRFGYGSLMSVIISGGKTPSQVINERRATEDGAFIAGNLATIKNECRLLGSTYRARLNQYDMQRLLEAYLLTSHREYLTQNIVESCLERPMTSPANQLTYKILADEIVKPLSKYDTFFLRNLYNGQAAKVLKPNVGFVDRSGELGVSTTTAYLALKNTSMPLCHTFLTYNEAAFVQLINSKPYYVSVTIDQPYTPAEVEKGKRSKVENIYISKIKDTLYEEKDGVSRCLNSELQKTGLAKI